MSNVIKFPGLDAAENQRRYDAMFAAIHLNAVGINALTADLGTPNEWLVAAIQHLNCTLPPGGNGGRASVSVAAVSLLIMKVEELMFDGPKVVLPLRD